MSKTMSIPSFFAANGALFFCISGFQEENISLGLPQIVDVFDLSTGVFFANMFQTSYLYIAQFSP